MADRPAAPDAARPSFVITIDVEADDAWRGSGPVTTRNAAFLPRFQELCERYGLRPTYLVDWAMARSPLFQRFGHGVLERGTAELGMHLHAWTTPPLVPLTADDHRYKPFLLEYPREVMAAKIETATTVLSETFGVTPVSHRAGRWMLDERYARLLIEHGYLVDCSVTPHVSWRGCSGAPGGRGPRDYTFFPENPYFVDPRDIAAPGDPPLLEVPMTIARRTRPPAAERVIAALPRTGLPRRVAARLLPEVSWMRPNGRNRRAMAALAGEALRSGRDHVEFMLHSSELMPGGSPYFRTRRGVEALYRDMEHLFAFVAGRFQGRTLAEYRARFTALAGRAG
ncbi:deacetylase [Sphaerisporangium melleum]|uniref:Deacetylase n=1 Tax=Sphaerisporangium melleum TaxID=321316 RepID=A0A917QT91_9ACTN|nr:deacetylase [Sphaerisporangium melleum]GGK67483.1 deacetylase [Sphaerisporangium melleum]GII68473.1 deacetylase [Sphaerisporangium melleum]